MIVGTAGHVDHGKTTLVKAITGIDTDRLPEEKRRGITLELGFAHLPTPDGGVISVIDVPGHEKLVKAMAAGAGGIDAVLLVIAADEGVMPQTREHLDICQLLGVPQGAVVLTKCDAVEQRPKDWLQSVEAEVQALVKGTFLATASVHRVSALLGTGIDGLRQQLLEWGSAHRARHVDGPLFLPIDRVFSMKGHGCVVTGTVRSGAVQLQREVSLSPTNTVARVRGLQVHGRPVERAHAGERVAVNLAGLEPGAVHRGAALVQPHQLSPATSLDVQLQVLTTARALPVRTRLLLSLGVEQLEVAVRLYDSAPLSAGATGFARLTAAKPFAAMPGLSFVLRGFEASPSHGATVGGGRVLALDAPRRRKAVALEQLRQLSSSELNARLLATLNDAGFTGRAEADLIGALGESPSVVRAAVEQALARRDVELVDRSTRRLVAQAVVARLAERAVALLEQAHRESPERGGLSRETLRSRLFGVDERLLSAVLASQPRLNVSAEMVKLTGLGASAPSAPALLAERVLEALKRDGLAPRSSDELAKGLRASKAEVDQALGLLSRAQQVHRSGALFFEAGAVARLEAEVVAYLTHHPSLTTLELKRLVGQSRKFLIPLAELLDARKLTLRVGDTRVLRRGR